jgi:precorrin-2 dehydrogenase/sirohydrochlorin ferrochelatase
MSIMALSDSALLPAHDRVHPGGSLIVAWQLKQKRVLIVGGGEVASSRLVAVLSADAVVTLVSPRERLEPSILAVIKHFPQRIKYHDRIFKDVDLEDASVVLTCIDDVETSRRIVTACRERKIPVNAADLPHLCDFYFGSVIRQGPLQIMISTNGNGPKLANVIKRRIQAALPSNVGKAIENVGHLRGKLHARAPGAGGAVSISRMSWMSQLCERWSFDELAAMDEPMMKTLLDEGWEKRELLTFQQAGGVLQWTSRRQLVIEELVKWKTGWSAGFVTGCIAGGLICLLHRKLL